MDKVVSKQNQYKRALEKQLDDIKVTQHQTEARRLREIRDLGVDLSRIQSASRHLEYIEDLNPRGYLQRRSSLPLLVGDSGALTLNFEAPSESRSRRRLSCGAALPLISSDSEMSDKDLHRGSNKEDIQQNPSTSANWRARKGDCAVLSEQATATKSKTSLADSRHGREAVDIVGRRGSSGGNGNNDGHNISTFCVHDDKQTSQDTASSSDHTPEEESPSSPDMRRRGRRASEPAVGGFFIRRLQANVYNDTQFVQQRSSVESAELRRSIQKYLPSDIVAEEDEEEADSKCISRSTQDIPRHFSDSSEKLESSLNVGKGSSGSMTSSKDVKIKDLSKDKTKTSKGSPAVTKSGSYTHSRARRSSDGDVLSHISRKFHQEKKGQGDNSPGNPRVLSAASRNKNVSVETNDENNEVWQAVRKCRYLRGYDPPEMTEPANMKEFVFGHENIDSLPPESK